MNSHNIGFLKRCVVELTKKPYVRSNGMKPKTESWMIYWSDVFNPRTPNFNSKLIECLIKNIEGLELILESSDSTTFLYDECEISMTWDSDYYGDESWFTFTLLSYPNDTPVGR